MNELDVLAQRLTPRLHALLIVIWSAGFTDGFWADRRDAVGARALCTLNLVYRDAVSNAYFCTTLGDTLAMAYPHLPLQPEDGDLPDEPSEMEPALV